MEIKHFFGFRNRGSVGFGTLVWMRSKIPMVEFRERWVTTAAIVFCALLWFGGEVLRRIDEWAETSPRFRVPAESLVIDRLPEWILPFASEIVPSQLPQEGVSLLHPDASRDVAMGYRRNPWVREVRRIARHYPNRISVELCLRKPAAWVSSCGLYFLADSSGVRLPGLYEEPVPSPHFLPLVTGVDSTPPEPGCVWQDTCLQAALRAVDEMERSGLLSSVPISKIQLESASPFSAREYSERGIDKRVVLIAGEHVRIVWGRVSSFSNVPAERKAEALRRWIADEGFSRSSEIDIRFGFVVIRRGEKRWTNPTSNASRQSRQTLSRPRD